MTKRKRLGIAAGMLLCAAFGRVWADPSMATSNNLPPERQQGPVVYRTGGIGEDEAQAMKDAARQYPLALEFVARTGEDRGGYLADVDVSIQDRGGNQVLQTKAAGPFLLARLPAGHYVVTASNQDARRSQRVDVSARGSKRIVFGW